MTTPHKHDLRYLPISELVPNEWNPQEQDDATFNRLVDEIKEVGFVDPCEVVPMNDGSFKIIGGEHRWKAASAAGLDEVPCIILSDKKWQDEDLQKFVTVRLNVLKGKLNPDKFLQLYTEMASKYGKEPLQKMMGYTDSGAFQKLLGGVKAGMKKALPKEMQEEFEKNSSEAKSAEDLGKIINSMFAKYGDTVQHSFMIFTHGKQEHIYVTMDKKMRMSMDKLMAYCKESGEDINSIMAPLTDKWMEEAETKLVEQMAKRAPKSDVKA